MLQTEILQGVKTKNANKYPYRIEEPSPLPLCGWGNGGFRNFGENRMR